MGLSKFIVIVIPITIIRGFISGIQPSIHIIMLKWNLSPAELATKMLQYNMIFSIYAWFLLIVFLLSLYFLCMPQSLLREYKKY